MKEAVLQNRLSFFWPGHTVKERVTVGGVNLIIGYGRRDAHLYEGIFIYCVSDKRPVLDGYMQKIIGPADSSRLDGEIRRLAHMSLESWEEFLRQRACYNPFLDRRNRQRVKAGDRGLRHMWSQQQFKDSDKLTAIHKLRLAHDYEKLVTACVFGGKSHAISRLPDRLYPVLAALYFPSKLTKAELRRAVVNSIQEHLQLVIDGKTASGEKWEQDEDLKKIFFEVAKAYIHYVKKFK